MLVIASVCTLLERHLYVVGRAEYWANLNPPSVSKAFASILLYYFDTGSSVLYLDL